MAPRSTPRTPPAAPTSLRVNLLKAPFGVDKDRLRFSWVMNSTVRNDRQTAYRLVVARSAEQAERGEYLYDSDWVATAQSTAVVPAGLSLLLTENTLYRWQVAIRNAAGEDSPFSAPAVFSTAMGGSRADTRGIWHTRKEDGGTPCFVFLRTEFSLSDTEFSMLDRATLSVTAISPEPTRQYVYNMYVNGVCVGVGPARLGKNPMGQTVLYGNTYDMTEHLVRGENCLSSICYATDGRLFLCQLTAHFKDGTSRILCHSARDAADWRVLDGDAVFGIDNSIGTPYYYTAHANNMDMTRYPSGFDRVGFDDVLWSVPAVGGDVAAAVDAVLAPSETDPVTRYESDRRAVSVTRLDGNMYRIDLGAEIVGCLRFTVNSPAVCTVTVRYGEQLNPDGTVKYRMNTGNVYTETWRLRAGEQTVETVDMMTFRYVQIENPPVAITPDMVTGLELRTAMDEEESDFTADNDLLCDIYALMKHTVKVTTQDIYVDSQARERGAYEGDLLINLLAAYAVRADYSTGRFSAEYLYTHRTWPAEYILLAISAAKADYMTTGDITSLRAYYDILKEKTFTAYLNGTCGLLTSGNAGGAGTNAILVDWPPSERDSYDMGVTYNTVLNALAAKSYADLSDIARVTGHDRDAESFAALAEGVKTALIGQCYDPDRGAFRDGLSADGTPSSHFSQHATAYALVCGMYTDRGMADRLAAFVAEREEICMSVYGAWFLLMGLYAADHGAVANRLLLNPDSTEGARTWAYMLHTLGATVTTEAWNPVNKPNMTLSHPWGAAPAHAIAGGIFGIRPTAAGYDTFEVRLQTAGLTEAAITVPTVKGSISVSFRDGDTYTASVTVPANTTATVSLPASEGERLLVDGTDPHAAYANGYLTATVGAGAWTFEIFA